MAIPNPDCRDCGFAHCMICSDIQFTTRECKPAGSNNIAGSLYEHDPEYHFLFRSGKVLPLGELLYRPGYAKTLRILAERGVEAFYEGEIAEALVRVVQERGGLMCLEDLKGESASTDSTWYHPGHQGVVSSVAETVQIINPYGASRSALLIEITRSGRSRHLRLELSGYLPWGF